MVQNNKKNLWGTEKGSGAEKRWWANPPVKQSFFSLQSKWHLIWFYRWSFLISWMIPRHPFGPLFHERLAISWGKSLGKLSRTTVCTHTCTQIDMPHNGILKWNHLERACEKLSLGTFSHRVTWRLRWQAVARQCIHFHLEKWDSRSRTESSNQFSSRKCSEISLMCVRPQWFPVAVQKE